MLDLFRLSVDANGSVALVANVWIALAVAAVLIALSFGIPWLRDVVFKHDYEINEIEIGVGSGKVRIKPSHEDRQIAYRLWVELKTRKLGIPFEEDHDVISEVYNSWYEFFRITRELIKAVPVATIRRRDSTQLLVGLSIDVLNKAIRPHLTKWQARYRHWLEVEMRKQGSADIPPQELQRRFPEYRTLVSELKCTNGQLVAYAKILADILELGAQATRDQRSQKEGSQDGNRN